MRRSLKLGAMAAAALFAAACGGSGASDTCDTDADCPDNQVCHNLAKACVTSCAQNSDCPSTSPTCGTLNGVSNSDGGTKSFCQCTATSCGSSSECNADYKVCLQECTGTDCNQATTCNSADPQPSACSYGQYCNGTTCAAVAAPTCSNFDGSPHAATWSTSSTGPVVYSLAKEGSTSAGSGCTNFAARVKAYRTTGTFPGTRPELALIFHVVGPDTVGELDSSTIIDGTTIVRSNNNMNIEFVIRPCGNLPYSLGVHFDDGAADGNEICTEIQ